MKQIFTSIIIIALLIIFGYLILQKKLDISLNEKLVNTKSSNTTQSPEESNFPPSQRSIDGFFIGQHISVVTNIFGEPDHPDQIINKEEGELVYTYWLDEKVKDPTFLVFGVYNPESGIIADIQLTGDKSDKETFLGLKLGDSKEKVISILGNPSKIELGTRNGDFYIYNDRNYSVQLSKEGKLFSIKISTLRGFTENIEIGDFIKNFTDVLNTNDINKISEFLMPEVEVYVKDKVLQITKRFLDELFDLNSEIMKYLLFAENSVKNILNNYKGEIDMQLRITDKGPTGYVYKFTASKVLEEIFVIEHAGKWRVYEIKYRNSNLNTNDTLTIENINTDKVSKCLKLLEKVNLTSITENKWEAFEISEINGIPVSINNLGVKTFQEVIQKRKDIQVNYGPFLMEKTEKKGGKFIQETNQELIKCAQDKIIISIWQPI
jgi:hypothetical protein